MTEYISNFTRIGFAREDTFGTKPSAFGGSGGGATVRFLGITPQALDFPDKQLEVKKYRSFGTGRKYFLNKAGRRTRTATLSFLPVTGASFYWAFGQDTHTVGTPDIHAMSPKNAATLPSFTLGTYMEGSPNFQRSFTGATVDTMNVTLGEGGELTCSVDIMAKDVEDEQSASPAGFTQPVLDDASVSPTPYMFYDTAANVTLMGTYGTDTTDPPVAASGTYNRTIARVAGFSWRISNNLRPRWFKQSSSPQNAFAFYTGYPDFSLSMEIVPAGKLAADTDALYDILEAEPRADVQIPFQKVGSSDKLYFVFRNCMMAAAPHSWPEDGHEVTVAVTLEPEEIRVISRDEIGTDYDSL